MTISRDERQAENIENWTKFDCCGTLEACTGLNV